jgi:hypothetical protein
MSEPAPGHVEEHAPELDVTHARQGRRGRHAFMILICSLGLVLIAFVAVFVFNYGNLAGLRGNREAEPQVAKSVDTAPQPAKQTPEQPSSGG